MCAAVSLLEVCASLACITAVSTDSLRALEALSAARSRYFSDEGSCAWPMGPGSSTWTRQRRPTVAWHMATARGIAASADSEPSSGTRIFLYMTPLSWTDDPVCDQGQRVASSTSADSLYENRLHNNIGCEAYFRLWAGWGSNPRPWA